MGDLTLIWTSLPAGVRRKNAAEPWMARISVVLTPRLETPDGPSTLGTFPEFLDWPQTLGGLMPSGIEFDLALRSDGEVIATTIARIATAAVDAPDSRAWNRIFDAATPVENFDAPARTANGGARVDSYNGGDVIREIRNYYGEVLQHDLGLTDEQPPLAKFALHDNALLGADLISGSRAIENFARFHQPANRPDNQPLRAAADEELNEPTAPDFHQIVAALGSHPQLLKKLGLVMDFEFSLDELPLDRATIDPAIRLVPRNADFGSTLHHALWTAVDYRVGSSSKFRLFSAAEPNKQTPAALFTLAGDTTIAQEKFEHAALALMQQAQTGDAESQEIPALLQGGMRVTHSGIPRIIERAMDEQAALERSLSATKTARARGLFGSADEDETLYANQLTLGVRADVRYDDVEGRWRSLCKRSIRYRAGDWVWPADTDVLDDEGLIEPTAYTDHFADAKSLRATTDLFEWDGWSLVVPRPDDQETDTTLLPAEVLPDGAAPLTATISVAPGSLEPQRFGRCYTFRTRTVYLAGVGISAEEADEIQVDLDETSLTTTPTCCLRVESAKPPVTIRAQDRGYGEAGDIVVLRDADDKRYRTHEYKLHVLPPEVPLRIAEKHGVFDSLSPAESWTMIENHRGKLNRDEDAPDVDEQPALAPKSETVDADELFTPYLPDPMVKQAVLILPDGASKVDLPRFDDLPRHVRGKELARSCRLIFRAGRNSISARASGRDVIVELTRGRMHTLEIAAKLSPEELSIAAVAHADWHGDNRLAKATDKLASAAANGEAPIVAPARKIRVVYATQRPLVSPAFGRALILPRSSDDTSALFGDDALYFDRPSTGRIDIYARWEDPVDDVNADGWTTVASEMHAGGVDIDLIDGKPLDPIELEKASRSPLSHDFGDTRHHEVTYTAVATSRFADFYPAEVTTDTQNTTQISDSITLHVPSTAPPAAPNVAYVVPTYRKDRAKPISGINAEYAVQQQGEGLRVYLERGWFSSGKGEQLALVVATPNTPQELREQISEWGINPLRDAAPLPGPLEMAQVWGGSDRIEHWPLDEGNVGLVIYDVHWSDDHDLPFVDIEFMSQRAFMPLVRLALARYQRHAIENCELSGIVHADFVPLTPGRAVTVSKLNRTAWKLEMRGYSYSDPARRFDIDAQNLQTSVVEAQVEVMPKNAPADDATWRPVGDVTELTPNAVEPWRFHWTGQVNISDFEFLSPIWRRRLVIREYEVFSHGGNDDVPLADRSRLISAHSVKI